LELEVLLIVRLLVSVNWDYDRFAESERKRCSSGKYFPEVHMGKIIKLTTVVDMHGKILMWYLPGLLLPQRVVSSIAPVQNIFFY
jgi:hypothetical protein